MHWHSPGTGVILLNAEVRSVGVLFDLSTFFGFGGRVLRSPGLMNLLKAAKYLLGECWLDVAEGVVGLEGAVDILITMLQH